MAKIGEGDERWIVNDLGITGRNVGRWHWADEDVLHWCKDELKKRLKGIECYSKGNMRFVTTQVNQVDGEASIMNRKRKLIAIYELKVEIGWKAYLLLGEPTELTEEDSEKCIVAKGLIKLPYLSEENGEDDDFEINVDLDSSCKKQEHKLLRETFRTEGLGVLKSHIKEFLKVLRNGAYVGEKYKLWEEEEKEIVKKVSSSNDLAEAEASSSVNKNVTEGLLGVGGGHVEQDQKRKVEIKITEKFKGAPLSKIFEMFTEPSAISQYTQSRAEIEKKVGGKFSLFSGKISGEFVEFVPNSKIVQKWRFDDWPDNVYSKLTINFEDLGGGETNVKLHQVDIPYKDKNGYFVKEKVQKGWDENFFRRIKMMLGMFIGSSGF